MAQYIDKSALVAEIDRQKIGYNVDGKHSVEYDTTRKILNIIDSLEVKEVDLGNYDKVKKLLSLSFMHFLDVNRPVGKMCLSNGECFDIDKAFDKLDFAKLFRYMEKYLKAQKGEEL